MAKRMLLSILLIILLVLTGTLVFSLSQAYITGSVTDEIFDYSYTKAVCTSANYCRDYEIRCSNKDVISMSPITGAAVQFSSDWKDPRDKEDIEKLC